MYICSYMMGNIGVFFVTIITNDMSDKQSIPNNLHKITLPDEEVIDYIISKTKHTDRVFVAASIIAHRYDDPKVPSDIRAVLQSGAVGK